ncbi:MAG TPA: T9SS type A sorting domain-containing protein [Bacteroidota bacterium]|nr:T9SS type A sorting domain-containing protein [Bacteroidota bacterium]
MKKLALLFCFLLASASALTAQVSTIPFQQYIGTYNTLTGGTTLTTGLIGGYDDGYWSFPIGFTFTFQGNSYTTAYAGTNGYLTLGAGTTNITNTMYYGFYYNYIPANGLVLSPFNLDSRVDPAFPIRYEVSGSAPNRVLTVQFQNMQYWSGGAGTAYNYQVRLHETSGMVEFIYGNFTETTSRTVYCGISRSATDFHRRVALTSTNTWATSYAETISQFAYSNANPTFLPTNGLTYRFGCYTPAGTASVQMVDAAGNPMGYFLTPGMTYAQYMVSYPPDQAYDVTITLNFHRIGDPNPAPEYSESFVVHKPLGTLVGQKALNLNLQPGYYRVEAIFSMWNNCYFYEDQIVQTSTLFIAPGTVLCEVWPGDVNNDMVVNYTDRKSLNTYIYDANMRATWLQGPARYKIEGASNPIVYLNWEGQPSVPWSTASGCYMDTDGNGVVNNFDYIAIKLNWMKTHGVIMPKGDRFDVATFDMTQNYPNPFNPSTTLQYALPERSQVQLVVLDVLGRTVATLVDDNVEAGVHTVKFDAAALPSGQYVARVRMSGFESGLSFSKTITMTLAK